MMSPTIIQTKNLFFRIYPKDHKPKHVHIIGPDAEAKFNLETMDFIESYGFSAKSLKIIKEVICDNLDTLLEAWDDYQK